MTKRCPVKIIRIHPKAEIPKYQTAESVGFNIKAVDVKLDTMVDNGSSHLCYIIRTGLKVAVQAGFCMKIYPLPDLGFKNNARLANCVAIIPSDFRGELILKMVIDSGAKPVEIKEGMYTFQGVIEEVVQADFNEVTEDAFVLLDTALSEDSTKHTDKKVK